jgi:hypothetical protein
MSYYIVAKKIVYRSKNNLEISLYKIIDLCWQIPTICQGVADLIAEEFLMAKKTLIRHKEIEGERYVARYIPNPIVNSGEKIRFRRLVVPRDTTMNDINRMAKIGIPFGYRYAGVSREFKLVEKPKGRK